MFPSGNSDNTFESLFKRTFVCDQIQNPISKQDDPSFFSNFPSPFFDEHELPLNQILSQNHKMDTGNMALLTDDQIDDHQSTLDSSGKESSTTKFSIIEASNMKAKEPDLTTISNVQGGRRRSFSGAVPAPRKRTGKKDRHSKICTAQGVRDRRMRLSLQVARKFFDLQDMLGYDKASKTIEWLFNKSKKAIKELAKDHPQAKNTSNISTDAKSESFVSECEVVSGIEENSNTDIKESVTAPNDVRKLTMNEKGSERKSRKTASNKPNMRESRDEARARARCRTREKMMKKRVEILSQFWHKLNPNHTHDIQKLWSSNNIIPFEAVEESNSSHNHERFSYSADYHHLADVGTIEKLLGTSTNTSSTSCPISDYQCSAAVSSCIDINSSCLGFLGNWDLLNNDKTNVNQYAVTNQAVSLPGNPNSIFLASPTFPFRQ